ncbi:MAG: magnesium transporter [Atopobiaceae bacterium]|nr:magnesium transporter [Atopobiaceae bacterium]
MIYLSQMLGTPVVDSEGEKIGTVNDMGIATGEVFPRVTSLAFQGPERTPFMISWRKYVESFDENEVRLQVPSTDIRFSYLQPNEILIARDLLNKQIVDTRGMKVVRVNDLKLSDTGTTLRLLGAEVGARGILRSLSPLLEKIALRVAKVFGNDIPEEVIAWNYMDLLDRDLSEVKLSVSHKTLDELHPADIAEILEQLDPRLRANVFAQLDVSEAAEAVAEIDDNELAAEIVEGMEAKEASRMLSEMDPDDAADLVSELGHDKAEQILRLMGVNERRAINQLLGYREFTAGRIMTSEFVSLPATATVSDVTDTLRGLEEDFEEVHYVYTTTEDGRLEGVVTLNDLLLSEPSTVLSDIEVEATVVASPDDDQEDVAKEINKYNLLSMPVVDDTRHLLGIVTVDDALDVLEEEHEEDLAIVGGATPGGGSSDESGWIVMNLLTNEMWFFAWALGAFIAAFVSTKVFGDPLGGLIASFAMPISLNVADYVVHHATNFFLEFDEEDENAPSMLGFAIRGMLVSLLFGAMVLAVTGLIGAALPQIPGVDMGSGPASLAGLVDALKLGARAAAIAIVASFATAPLYLAFLRKRDRDGKETNGLILRAVSLVISVIVFVAAFVAFAG